MEVASRRPGLVGCLSSSRLPRIPIHAGRPRGRTQARAWQASSAPISTAGRRLGSIRRILLLAALAASVAAAPVLAAPPADLPDDLAIVQPDGDVVPRAGSPWSALWDHGVSPAQVDGAEPDGDGGWLLPTKAAPPAWFDGTLRQRLEAGEAVPLEAVREEAGVGEAADLPGLPRTHEVDRPARPAPVGIRPGIGIGITPYCTAAFLYENVTNGDLAIATAGHCVSEGQDVAALVVQEEPRPSVRMLRPMGTVVHAVFGPDVPDDAALVDIRDRHEDLASPRMAGWGGPCGPRTAFSPGDSVVKWGQGTDHVLGSPRGGVVTGTDTRLLRWTGTQVPGDSGAGVRFATADLVHEEAGAAGIATRFDANPFTPWTANGPDTEYVQGLFPDQWQLVSSPDCPPGPT